MATPTVAASAYANLARILDQGGAGKSPDSGASAGGPSFGELLKDAMGSIVDGGKQADQQTAAMTTGKANVMDVVTAVAETDVKISTLVSVRDKVISAYEDIMKMAI
ncbi:flagellar hook-basal body complex protein FliE [Bradyrhizobium sp. dw_78]|uniref:flagellar hook-basal body complex protein FliE n=1 Tax=Bradyrhizobium sp. dw_78 TaxID=2719793 RepID=UPI001BD3C67C|nr:flagellar hook-basal body complex protein FliE [Bradyrhizobium sp. dw_78]